LTFDLQFLPDRLPRERLWAQHPAAANRLRAHGLLEGSEKRVRFVGIASISNTEGTFFLPHGSPHEKKDRDEFAQCVMKAISRFGRENSRVNEGALEDEGPSNAALLHEIATDFRDFGIFSERLSVKSKNSGKPEWSQTIRKEVPLYSNQNLVFPTVRTVRPVDASENVLAAIQRIVLCEIYANHSWWLADAFGSRKLPRNVSILPGPRKAWRSLLAAFRQSLFSDRALRLASLLERYLANIDQVGEGALVLGISDFSTLWEKMLNEVLPNIERGWNEKLAGPVYRNIGGDEFPSGRMLMDAVARTGTRFLIIDAKYYTARSVDTSPSWPDVVKQLYYQKAMEALLKDPESEVQSCFIFPASRLTAPSFDVVQMRYQTGRLENTFPNIYCYYLNTEDVVRAYISGKKLLDLNLWRAAAS
jgi:hypothetical protein